jgi:hypothetical protein
MPSAATFHVGGKWGHHRALRCFCDSGVGALVACDRRLASSTRLSLSPPPPPPLPASWLRSGIRHVRFHIILSWPPRKSHPTYMGGVHPGGAAQER